MKRTIVMCLLIVTLGTLAYVAGSAEDSNLRFERSALGRIRRTVTVVGPVLPETHVVVQPKLPSRVSKIYVQVGQSVTKGQDLVLLDTTEVAMEVRRKELNLKRAEFRVEQLAATNGSVPAEPAPASREVDLKLAQLDLELAKLELAKAQDMAREAVLKSPIDGAVVQIGAQVGEMLYPNRPANEGVIVSAADRYAIRAEIDEFELSQLSVGLSATIHFDAVPNIQLSGQILKQPVLRRYRIDSRQGATFELTVTISDQLPKQLIPGLTGVAEIVVTPLDQPERVTVPQAALVRLDDQDYVVERPRSGPLRLVAVVLGDDDDQRVEVRSGLAEGALVAVGDLSELARRLRAS